MTTPVLVDLESWMSSSTPSDFVTLNRLLALAGAPISFGTSGVGSRALVFGGGGGEQMMRRIFSTAGITTGTRGARMKVTGAYGFWAFYDAFAAKVQCSLVFDASLGQVRAYTGDVFFGTGGSTLIVASVPGAFVSGGEMYVEAGITIGTGTSGAIVVKINEVTVIDDPGCATQVTANAWYNTTKEGYAPNLAGSAMQISDLYWTQGSTFFGPGQVFALVPSANASVQFTPLSGTNYQMVDSLPPQGDLAYNLSSTPGQIDLFTTNAPVVGTAVKGAMISRNSRIDAAGARVGQSLLKSGSTTFSGALTNEFSSYVSWFDCLDNDPNTGSPFTIAAINAAQPGYTLNS